MKTIIKNRNNFKLLRLMIFFFIVFAQESESQTDGNYGEPVSNVMFTSVSDDIIVTYDLAGTKEKLSEVKLILRKKNSATFRYEPKNVTGDVGEGHFAGRERRIVWNVKKDFPNGLPGDDYYFEVQVKELDGESDLLMWIGVGLASTAAVITYIFISNEGDTNDDNGISGFPDPPGRP